jgi:hypothetical protein
MSCLWDESSYLFSFTHLKITRSRADVLFVLMKQQSRHKSTLAQNRFVFANLNFTVETYGHYIESSQEKEISLFSATTFA